MTTPTNWQADLDERIAEACGETHKMTDTKADPFAKATPRPWTRSVEELRGGRYFTISRGTDCEPIDLHEDDNGDADSALIIAAVNAYSPEREQQVRDLVRAARSTANWLIDQSRYKNAGHAAGHINVLERALAVFPEAE